MEQSPMVVSDLHLLPRFVWSQKLLLGVLATLLGISGCFPLPSFGQVEMPVCLSDTATRSPTSDDLSLPLQTSPESLAMLQQSWVAYRGRFIQNDGRVIDREENDRTVSEGQAYAMLRAVLIDDPETFVKTLAWAEENLERKTPEGDRADSLWAWKWGRHSNGEWKTIDGNFASDADLDAATALILAARRWNCPQFLDLAKVKLQDLWELSVVTINGTPYFIPGPREVFERKDEGLVLNPSYLSPYAFRLFAQVDPGRNWMGLVESSYTILEDSSAISEAGLPSDWIVFNPTTEGYEPLPADDELQSRYSFDAYRVWWRVALDATWFDAPEAKRYLDEHLPYLETLWRSRQAIPARLDLQGRPLVDYEATAQYAMLHAAFQVTNPAIAEEIYRQKLMPTYRNGFWDSDTAYYTQNLAWFGLLPPEPPEPLLRVALTHSSEPSARPVSRSISAHRARLFD
jgi:endo-1,4-beta-D-glucanase Y